MYKIMLIQLIIVIAVGTGWVMNIVKLARCDFEPSYKEEVIRVIGVVPPVGMIVGWINFNQEED